MNFEQARFNMVEQQIRPWEVLDQDVLDLLYVVPREEFVPPAHRALAFTDMEIPIGEGERMWAPRLEARARTLQQIRRPLSVLDEMLRVARRALVVVPNFGHWRVRLQLVLGGRTPVTDSLPYEWFESPNVHLLTMLDFRDLASRGNFKIVKELPIIGDRAVNRAWLANLPHHSASCMCSNAPSRKRPQLPLRFASETASDVRTLISQEKL